jgi:hypothetical protein
MAGQSGDLPEPEIVKSCKGLASNYVWFARTGRPDRYRLAGFSPSSFHLPGFDSIGVFLNSENSGTFA